jgi:acetyl-CoA carboxylase carboxyltransferase component
MSAVRIKTARERLDLLIDLGTFLEYGILAGSPASAPKPTPTHGSITGLGKINDRDVVLAVYDFTVYGGSQAKMSHRRIDCIQRLAIDNGIPMVYLCDGGSARAQELGRGVGDNMSTEGGTFIHIALMKAVSTCRHRLFQLR